MAAFVAYGGGDLPDDVDSVAERIYSDANLSSSGAASYPDSDAEQSDDEDGTDACDNGLLLIYAVETRSLFFYPGSSLAGVFDHLQTHKRRIEPKALPSYLEAMLAILQRRTPDSLAIQRTSPARVGWSGWEVVVGMIGAVIIVSITAAAILAVVLTGCFRVKRKGPPYVDELEACRRYEKECKEWTKRARHLAKQRAKIMRAMQKPNWAAKVEAARRRLNERKSSSVVPLGSAAEPTDVVGGPTGDQPQPTFPYYIVSEPSSVYNSNHFFNWTSADEGDTAHVDQTPLGTMRSDRHGVGSMMTDGIPGRSTKRETQRCDFYFQDEQ